MFASAAPVGGAVDRVTITRRSAGPSDVLKVSIRGTRGAFAQEAPDLPLKVTVVLDPTSDAGLCSELAFTGPRPVPACRRSDAGDMVICR